jgi:hypothetical protein
MFSTASSVVSRRRGAGKTGLELVLALLVTVLLTQAGVARGASTARACGARGVCVAVSGHVARRPLPRLGTPLRQLPGFGQVAPHEISFGGDPTSLVTRIHWTHWGAREAIGVGESDWVWPGTCVACNPESKARVVAFHLGTCHGHASYNAFEWYFPEYGDTFRPGDYSDPCTHRSVDHELPPPLVKCQNVPLDGGGTASGISAQSLTCEAADALIAQVPRGPFKTERRFEVAGFRCGTAGAIGTGDLIDCEQDEKSLFYSAEY